MEGSREPHFQGITMLTQPSSQTLKRYGLSLTEWKALADKQKHACFVCEKEPTKGRLCIDHEHVKRLEEPSP
jgi:hypothetical protein